MIRELLVLSLVFVTPVIADVSCVKPESRPAVSLLASGRPFVAAPLVAGDSRAVRGIVSSQCTIAAGEKVDVLSRAADLVTVRVAAGPAVGCVGEIAASEIATCGVVEETVASAETGTAPAAPRAASARTVAKRTTTLQLATDLVLSNHVEEGPKIAKWKTPEGRLFFGDRPPRGSVRVGEITGVAAAGAVPASTKEATPATAMAEAPDVVGGDMAAITADDAGAARK